MKNRIGLIVLAGVCVVLGIVLVVFKTQASKKQHEDADTISALSNTVATTSDELKRQKEVNASFEKDLETRKKDFSELTNNYSLVSSNLTDTTAKLNQTAADLQASQAEVAKRDARIADLEVQNQALDKQALDLSTAITNLTGQITETSRKLAASEGDKVFLEGELKRLTAERDELQRQFNDLTVLRAQVAKLKEELNISRRLEWIRQGLFANSEQKGAQKLMQGFNGPAVAAQPKAPKPNYDLNVEVSADGSVKVIPPLTGTNAAPAR